MKKELPMISKLSNISNTNGSTSKVDLLHFPFSMKTQIQLLKILQMRLCHSMLHGKVMKWLSYYNYMKEISQNCLTIPS